MKVAFLSIIASILCSVSVAQADTITCSKQYKRVTYHACLEISPLGASVYVSKNDVTLADQKFKTVLPRELHDLNVTTMDSPMLEEGSKAQINFAELYQGGPVLNLLLRGSVLPKKMKFTDCRFSI